MPNSTTLHIRCTPAEKASWTAKATSVGADLSAWARHILNASNHHIRLTPTQPPPTHPSQ